MIRNFGTSLYYRALHFEFHWGKANDQKCNWETHPKEGLVSHVLSVHIELKNLMVLRIWLLSNVQRAIGD